MDGDLAYNEPRTLAAGETVRLLRSNCGTMTLVQLSTPIGRAQVQVVMGDAAMQIDVHADAPFTVVQDLGGSALVLTNLGPDASVRALVCGLE